MLKRELHDGGDSSSSNKKLHSEVAAVNDADYQTAKGRRGLRSRYLTVTNMINDERDEMARPDSDKFDLIFKEMESLHQLVTKPREQVAEAKALLDITKSLVMSVKSNVNGGLTPSDFVTHILENFGGQCGPSNGAEDCSRNSIAWKDIGVAVSHVFRGASGCSTMIGPIDTKKKQRRVINRRKRVRPTELARPEEVELLYLVCGFARVKKGGKVLTGDFDFDGPINDAQSLCGDSREERTETDINMLVMFDILRTNKVVKLENLVLNRNSFAQTVENLFALSFLVKDGRAEIKVNEAGLQLVSPRNAPAANSVISKDVSFRHFVFRFDFNDWKLMAHSVGVGEELMPHRNSQ